MIASRFNGRSFAAVLATSLVLPTGGVAASDVRSHPVITTPSIATCAPGALTVGLGCLRIGGSVEASMAVASVPAWQTNAVLPRPTRAPSGATLLSQPSIAARLSADVRVPTELGPVRAYVSVRNLPVRRADGF